MRNHTSRQRFRIEWEPLEDRRLPATFLPAVADYDGDGRADLGALPNLDPMPAGSGGAAVYLTDQTSDGTFGEILGIGEDNGGTGKDVPVPLDFDGDGKADFAVYGPYGPGGDGRFLIIPSSGDHSDVYDINLGQPLDVPAVGNFDGSNRDEIGVYGPYGPGGTGRFLYVSYTNAVTHTVLLGDASDKPAIADYDGDGKDDFAVYGPDGHGGMRLLYLPSDGRPPVTIELGSPGDIPVPADYSGNSKADPAVYGPNGSGGMRFFKLPSNGGPSSRSRSVSPETCRRLPTTREPAGPTLPSSPLQTPPSSLTNRRASSSSRLTRILSRWNDRTSRVPRAPRRPVRVAPGHARELRLARAVFPTSSFWAIRSPTFWAKARAPVTPRDRLRPIPDKRSAAIFGTRAGQRVWPLLQLWH